ncbi:DUF1786 family protein [uncultured Mailhella sp.]|uniref:DUF1786 family protein n=1 Tax=uncultured Mailhella sp. TaxID=1981031 RepID=UPI0025CDA072|nr:DUF1786 family protein [uncultured Mailhella sp.]
MLDTITAGFEPSCPTLLLDNGSLSTAAVLALPGTDFSRWPKTGLSPDSPVEEARNFLKSSGLPAPELTLISGMRADNPEKDRTERCSARIRRWKDLLIKTEGRPEYFLQQKMPGWEIEPLLEQAEATFGPTLGTDSGMASVLAALSMEPLRQRSWSEGITVIWAGHRHVQAFMIYQERLLGLYEQHSDISREELLKDLDEMRLNWLPDEQVRARGGHGCICGAFPAEAEGFRPTWILGPCRETLKGCGRLSSVCGDDRFDRSVGLLYGLSLRKSS